MKKSLVAVLSFVLCVVLGVGAAMAAAKKPAKPAASPAVAANDDESGPERTARLNGFQRCLPAIKAANDQAFGEQKYSYSAQWNQKEPVKHAFDVQGVRIWNDGPSFVSYSVMPNTNNSCDVIIQHSLVFDMGCAEAREKQFQDWTLQSPPTGGVTHLTRNGMDLYMISLNSGSCQTERHEIVTNFQP